MLKKLGLAVFSLLVIGVLFLVAGFTVRVALSPYQGPGSPREIIEVTRGTTPMSVAQSLEQKGMIRNATIFYWIGKIRGSWGHLKAGEYEVSASMTPFRILDTLISGISVTYPFLIREGQNSYEIAKDLESRGYGQASVFQKLIRDPLFIGELGLPNPPTTLEGFLFPDTYLLGKKMNQKEIVRLMVKRFQNNWSPNEDARAKELGMTRHSVITLASIVEKETGAPEERPMIAGVFHNRLKKKMKLQSDPTSIYGIWSRYNGNISRKDLLDPNPFNTYYIPALPVGPISNPGRDAIQAVLYPAEHHYLYFVSKNDGTHVFSATYEEHNRAVKNFQLNAKARAGKSWRDLNKRSSSSGVSP
jgi:UPF0755 protein